MKLFLVPLLMITALPLFSNEDAVSLEKQLLGFWTTQHDGDTVTADFKEGGKVIASEDGETMEGTYILNTQVTPHHLDITFDGDTMLTIWEFTEEGGFKMAEPGANRPDSFTDGKSVAVFTRAPVKEKAEPLEEE